MMKRESGTACCTAGSPVIAVSREGKGATLFMANYVLVYKGGGMPETDAQREAVLAAWGAWYGSLGQAVVDGGNPFGPSTSIATNGAVTDGASSGLTGYSVVKADNLKAATEMAKGCPILKGGGSIEVYETFNVM